MEKNSAQVLEYIFHQHFRCVDSRPKAHLFHSWKIFTKKGEKLHTHYSKIEKIGEKRVRAKRTYSNISKSQMQISLSISIKLILLPYY